ncbi:MAG: hypothetical protein Q8O26_01335 [Phreatobacter sp.]|uniref:hypothetical protein n=1 Tax=Phreatobacter sp. TaxID=1966341 RepID=UPI00273307BC|nr:hypothetical protein [Phreatobacter sp.]MDP2800503.1 hypothetical protein [Phreatobacter sp.]
MVFERSRGIALRATLIRLAVELALCSTAALAIGRGGFITTVAALMMVIYVARAVLWFITAASNALIWRWGRQERIDRFAEALQAVRLPVEPAMRGSRDVSQSLARALLSPDISREAAAFAYSTQGFVEAVHVHTDPLTAAMIAYDMARGMDLHIDRMKSAGASPLSDPGSR